MDKKKYYVNLGSQEISQIKYDNNDEFTIYATEDDVIMLRDKLDGMHNADTRAFFRAHVPIMLYHNDESNDDYDFGITEAFQMIYELGDEQTKEHIKNMGVLSDGHM